MDSRALTKIQSIILVVTIIIAATVLGAAYVLLSTPSKNEDIRIGICADLDSVGGLNLLRGATLAVEQINAEGGFLGRNLTIVSEDDDSEAPQGDIAVASNALTKLITVDKADFIIATGMPWSTLVYQDICSEHKRILFATSDPSVQSTQRVADNYEKYKYYFRYGWLTNTTSANSGDVQSIVTLGKATGLTKVGYLIPDAGTIRNQTIPYMESQLPNHGLEVVYRGLYPLTTTDFASYFAKAEEAKTEILYAVINSVSKSPTFVSEWHERQSPMLLCGNILGAADISFWNLTQGRAEFVFTRSNAVSLGYPLTSKVVPAKEAYLKRWGVLMLGYSASAYDIVRFILSDAVKRAGTMETDAVIKALEKTSVETTLARRFSFTSDHDMLVEEAGMTSLVDSSMLYIVMQWQNGTQVPVFPEALRIEADGTIKLPPWQGPWSK